MVRTIVVGVALTLIFIACRSEKDSGVKGISFGDKQGGITYYQALTIDERLKDINTDYILNKMNLKTKFAYCLYSVSLSVNDKKNLDEFITKNNIPIEWKEYFAFVLSQESKINILSKYQLSLHNLNEAVKGDSLALKLLLRSDHTRDMSATLDEDFFNTRVAEASNHVSRVRSRKSCESASFFLERLEGIKDKIQNYSTRELEKLDNIESPVVVDKNNGVATIIPSSRNEDPQPHGH